MNIVVMQYFYNAAIYTEFYNGSNFTFRINEAKRYKGQIPFTERHLIKKTAKGYKAYSPILSFHKITKENETEIKTELIKKL